MCATILLNLAKSN